MKFKQLQTIPLVILAVLLLNQPVLAQRVEKYVVNITSGGAVLIELSGGVVEGMNEVILPIDPIVWSIETYVGGVAAPPYTLMAPSSYLQKLQPASRWGM